MMISAFLLYTGHTSHEFSLMENKYHLEKLSYNGKYLSFLKKSLLTFKLFKPIIQFAFYFIKYLSLLVHGYCMQRLHLYCLVAACT